MLTKRIIPCLDVKDGRVVKGVNFVDLIDAGDPVSVAKAYSQCGADELVFLDITASHERRKTICQVVRETAKEVFIPLTVGGGISTLEDMGEVLRAGADKIAINTAAIQNPELIRQGAKLYGNQCIVVAVDGKWVEDDYYVFIHGGRTATGIKVVEWVQQAEKLGAGEILLTSMDRDGTKTGFHLDLTEKVATSVGIPVIASGGAGNIDDFFDVFQDGKADAALAASIFHFNLIPIMELKDSLIAKGIPMRKEKNYGL